MWPPILFRVKVLLRKKKKNSPNHHHQCTITTTSSTLLTFYLLISALLLFLPFLNRLISASASPVVQSDNNNNNGRRGAKLLIEEFLSDGDDDPFVPITVRPPTASSFDLNSDHSNDDSSSVKSSSSSKSSKSLSAKFSNHYQHKFLPFRVKIFNESEERPLPLPDDDQLADHTYGHYGHADPLLNFDAPLMTENFFDCTVRYQHYWRYYSPPAKDPYEDELLIKQQAFVDLPTPLQVEITGRRCDLVSLVLLQLKYKRNITQLVLRDTAVRSLDRHIFADARLTSLQRVDIFDCRQLVFIDQRVFDELSSLQVLRLYRCPLLRHFHRQALLGAKALRSFLWAENGCGGGGGSGDGQQPPPLHSELFVNLTRATAKHYLPVLEQLVIIGSASASSKQILQSQTSDSSNKLDTDLKLTKDDLAQLTQIRSLQLAGVHLRFIHPLTFTFLAANLRSLHIVDGLAIGSNGNHHHNRLSLDSLIALFTTLAKLGAKRVKLSWVNLSGSVSAAENGGNLPKQLLQPLGKLPVRTLLLRRIGLTSIAVDDFPPMPNLERLVLDGNPLTAIADHAFDGLEALVTLSLAGNRLHIIRSELFYNLPKLSYLDLSGDPLATTAVKLTIAPRTFVGLNLRVLHLSYQHLDPLPNKAFLGLHKTEELYLRGCALTSIEYLTFFFLKSLRLLDLSENGLLIESLRQTHEDSFFGLESVEVVKMASCNLLSYDLSLIFARLHERVQELDLSGNRLEHLSAEHFAQFGELRSLNLSGNQIVPWTNGSIFAGNGELVELDLRSNRLQTLSSSMMEDLYRMSNLSFGGNPLDCDCSSEVLVGGWLASTLEKPILYMDSANPLHSREQYYCVLGEEEDEEEFSNGDKSKTNSRRSNLQQYSRRCARRLLTSRRAGHLLLNSYLVILFTLTAFLISFAVLAVAFVYYGELNQLIATYFWSRSAARGDEDEDGSKYEYDAFVSYNVADSEWIFSELVPNIERSSSNGTSSSSSNGNSSGCQRVRLCVYDRDFIAGRPISECILESIRVSRRVILVISNAFIRSPWCRYETDLAAHHSSLNLRGRTDGLVLIKLEQLEPGLSVPLQLDYLLKTRIYLQWDAAAGREERQKFWSKLKIALGIEQKVGESAREADKQSPQTKVSKLKRFRAKLSQLMDDLFSNWLDLELAKLPKVEQKVEVPEKRVPEKVAFDELRSTATRIKFKGRRKDLWRLNNAEGATLAIESGGQVHCTRYSSRRSSETEYCDDQINSDDRNSVVINVKL